MNVWCPHGWLLREGLGGLTWLLTGTNPDPGNSRGQQTSVPFLCSFARRKRISEEIDNWEKMGVGISHLPGDHTCPLQVDLRVIKAGSEFPCLYGRMY